MSDRFAPTTTTIGFLNVSLEIAAAAMAAWRERLYGGVALRPLEGSLPEKLSALQPLTIATRPREILIQTVDPMWTAYFDCSAFGTDAGPPISYLSRTLPCRAVYAESAPHTLGRRPDGAYGSVQFRLWSGTGQKRSIAAANDGGRWIFETFGVMLPFEQPEQYTNRLVRKRFTSVMLEAYCAAVGIEVFDEAFYSGPAVLFESPLVVRQVRPTYTFAENQARLHIRPGEAEDYPD